MKLDVLNTAIKRDVQISDTLLERFNETLVHQAVVLI
jgi:hypothetical protein